MNPKFPDDEPIVEDERRNSPAVPAASPHLATPLGTQHFPTTQPAKATETRLAWGCVGGSHNSWAELSGNDGDKGIVRIVEAGVVYTPPPKEAGLRAWQQVPGVPQRFEMPWTGDPYQLRTLDELGENLRKDRPKAGDDPRLAELNEAARRLLEIVSKLHEHGFRLGLLQPRTILLVPGTSGQELVLPDYGFVWKNAPGSRRRFSDCRCLRRETDCLSLEPSRFRSTTAAGASSSGSEASLRTGRESTPRLAWYWGAGAACRGHYVIPLETLGSRTGAGDTPGQGKNTNTQPGPMGRVRTMLLPSRSCGRHFWRPSRRLRIDLLHGCSGHANDTC